MEKAPFILKGEKFSSVIFGSGVDIAETIIRQFLILRINNFAFGKALLYSIGNSNSGVSYPLPPLWRKNISEHGFKTAPLMSFIVWNGFILLFLFYGIFCIAKTILACVKIIAAHNSSELGRFVYFNGLTSLQLPSLDKDRHSHDIISWYARWDGRIDKLDIFCHGVKSAPNRFVANTPVISVPLGVPPLGSLRLLMCYITWALTATTLATFDLFRGRWWHAFLLGEASHATLVKLQNPSKLAREYLFHNSNHTYRPLWTYEAEKAGAKISFYFYSTNNEEGFNRDIRNQTANIGWHDATWPNYLVWDKGQKDFIRRAVALKREISIVGPIWFTTSNADVPKLPLNSFTIFDVQPFRDAVYQTLGVDIDYYIPDHCNQFLMDIYKALTEKGFSCILKQKRPIGKFVHWKYQKLVGSLTGLRGFHVVDAGIAPDEIIEKCIGVISMPFTSTALVARNLGKPSYYYDPSGIIQKGARAAHGIPVISGFSELQEILAMESVKCNTIPKDSCDETISPACSNV